MFCAFYVWKQQEVVVTGNLGSCYQAFVSLTMETTNIIFIATLYICILAIQEFSNWKDATIAFRTHEQSMCH